MFDITETEFIIDGKGYERVTVRFKLNGQHRRLDSSKYALDVMGDYDRIMATEIEHLVDMKRDLQQQMKAAVKAGKIKRAYNTTPRD